MHDQRRVAECDSRHRFGNHLWSLVSLRGGRMECGNSVWSLRVLRDGGIASMKFEDSVFIVSAATWSVVMFAVAISSENAVTISKCLILIGLAATYAVFALRAYIKYEERW